MRQAIKRHPRRTIVLGFGVVILMGSLLLALPISSKSGQWLNYTDSLFTATSAVCVTGLSVVDTADTFSVLGQVIIAVLIQIGGLGITSIGVITILLASGKVSMGGRRLTKEAFNLSSDKGIIDVLKGVLYATLIFEIIGAAVSFIVFSGDFPLPKAIGVSFFHAISSFNNAGFDIFGGFKGLADYSGNIIINLMTTTLIIIGGIGFFVVKDVVAKKKFSKLTLHSKVVITTTIALIVIGTIMIKISEKTTWLSAYFHSVSARTAGFATEPIGNFSVAGLLVIIALMYIGASPGSTGGGIKTTTFFVIIRNIKAIAFNKHCTAFKRKIPSRVAERAMGIAILALAWIFISTLLIVILQPEFKFHQALFEVVSAFGTVGLSTGITPTLSSASEVVLVITMFIGRLGPLTLITLWWNKTSPLVQYTEEEVTVG